MTEMGSTEFSYEQAGWHGQAERLHGLEVELTLPSVASAASAATCSSRIVTPPPRWTGPPPCTQ